jgi:hypothetical protein
MRAARGGRRAPRGSARASAPCYTDHHGGNLPSSSVRAVLQDRASMVEGQSCPCYADQLRARHFAIPKSVELALDSMYTVDARPPETFRPTEVDDFVALVLAGGEVSAHGLRERVVNAKCISLLRRGECLVGVAGLKNPELSYRERIQRSSEVSLSESAFPFEIGWVFILPSARGEGQCLPLCRPVVAAAGGSGVFATSRETNTAMHATLDRLGFRRVGASWASKQNDDGLLLFIKPAV